MLLTPPDVISQSLLAVPIWLLFELGLLMSRIFLKDKEEKRVIMENDEFELIEEVPNFHEGEMPETHPVPPSTDVAGSRDDTHDDEQDEDRELTDEELEALFDEAEEEERKNNPEDEQEDSDESSKVQSESESADKPEDGPEKSK